MRNYFNSKEQSNHLIIMSAMVSAKELAEGTAPTDEEKKMLKKIIKLVNDFSESVYLRLGDGYKRSLINKASLNTLRLVSRNFSPHNDTAMEDIIDADILRDIIECNTEIDCAGCNSENPKGCVIYKIKSYLNYPGVAEENDFCPFRTENKTYDIDFDL